MMVGEHDKKVGGDGHGERSKTMEKGEIYKRFP